MKAIHQLLSCSCALFVSLQTPAFSDFTHTPGKSSVIVLQGEVTVDGQQRPDLGRSFADTITGGLLKTKAYSVLDHLGNQPLAQAIEASTHLAPEQSAVSIGKATGARYIYVPRMIVEGDFQKLTLKKIRVSDGQVVDVFESHSTGDRSNMFVLVGDALKDIYKEAPRHPTRLGKPSIPDPAPPEFDPEPVQPPVENKAAPPAKETKVAMADPQRIADELRNAARKHGLDGGRVIPNAAPKKDDTPKPENVAVAAEAGPGEIGATAAEVSPEKKSRIIDPATELEDMIAIPKGTISTINSEWRFCILKMSSKDLQIGDHLSVKTGKIVPNEVTLVLTKIEGHQAVGDITEHADLKSLRVGQPFYKWEPRDEND